MSVKFFESNHSYTSTDEPTKVWTSVTTAVHHFGQPFDSKAIATKSSHTKKSKWYGMTVDAIEKQWKATNTYSLELGTWYHKLMEKAILSHDTIEIDGQELKIIKPIIRDEFKYAPVQKLENNTKYPEHFTYLKTIGICGQADDIEVINGFVNVNDLKTNKEIKLQSFKNWEGQYQMMSAPFKHLQDCNYVHYCLQLSIYMYMILKHNPQLKPGKLTIKHILFEVESRDKFDNPIYKRDAHGNFIVLDTQDYNVPYMKNECIVLMNWLKVNQVPAKH